MEERDDPTQVAIACQGGGSHAGFCAGALGVLLSEMRRAGCRLTGLSGTSGGAVCAALAWDVLTGEGAEATAGMRAAQRLQEFWRELAAQEAWERSANLWGQVLGRLPLEVKTTPYALPIQPMLDAAARLREQLGWVGPRSEFVDLRRLLEKYMPNLDGTAREGPLLLLGAVDVEAGQFKAFSSRKGEIGVDAILASAALPELFRAVRIGDRAYWDGLFSQNPPIRDFLAEPETAADKPDEIWVLQLNPQTASEPKTARAIADRRNELSANLSLNHELQFIRTVNRWLLAGHLKGSAEVGRHKPVSVYRIVMNAAQIEEEFGRMDPVSKLNRSEAFIDALIEQGEAQARLFLPVRKFVRDVWQCPDADARRAACTGLFADGRAREFAQIDALYDTGAAVGIEIDDMLIRCEAGGRGIVELAWSARLADGRGGLAQRHGRAKFVASWGKLESAAVHVG